MLCRREKLQTHDIVQLPHQRSCAVGTFDAAAELATPRTERVVDGLGLDELRSVDVVFERGAGPDVLRDVGCETTLVTSGCSTKILSCLVCNGTRASAPLLCASIVLDCAKRSEVSLARKASTVRMSGAPCMPALPSESARGEAEAKGQCLPNSETKRPLSWPYSW